MDISRKCISRGLHWLLLLFLVLISLLWSEQQEVPMVVRDRTGGDSQEPWAYLALWSPAGLRAPPPAPGRNKAPSPLGLRSPAWSQILCSCVFCLRTALTKCNIDKSLFCVCDDFDQFCVAFKSPGTPSLRTRGRLEDQS